VTQPALDFTAPVTTKTFTARVAAYFKAHPGEWIPAIVFESVGGRQAWRTRISDCRAEFGMQIENRVRRGTHANGERWARSEYRYVPLTTRI
jgi:hypothetical protein